MESSTPEQSISDDDPAQIATECQSDAEPGQIPCVERFPGAVRLAQKLLKGVQSTTEQLFPHVQPASHP